MWIESGRDINQMLPESFDWYTTNIKQNIWIVLNTSRISLKKPSHADYVQVISSPLTSVGVDFLSACFSLSGNVLWSYYQNIRDGSGLPLEVPIHWRAHQPCILVKSPCMKRGKTKMFPQVRLVICTYQLSHGHDSLNKCIFLRLIDFYRPRTKYEGRYCFHRCLSVHISGEGIPSSRSGGGGVPHPRSEWRGTPSQVQAGGYPIPGPGRGVPIQGLDRGMPSSQWVGRFPSQV